MLAFGFFHDLLIILSRWGHVLAGITWIGLLYYFNFAQTPAFAAFEAGARNEGFAKLVPRAIWWFRYGAAATLGFGILLLALPASAQQAPNPEAEQALQRSHQNRTVADISNLGTALVWFDSRQAIGRLLTSVSVVAP